MIPPMTVTDPRMLTEILCPLRDAGHDVRHVTRLASRAELLRRVRLRGDRGVCGAAGRPFPEALRAPEFARHLHTDDRPLAAAEDVASHAGLTLLPDSVGRLRLRVPAAVEYSHRVSSPPNSPPTHSRRSARCNSDAYPTRLCCPVGFLHSIPNVPGGDPNVRPCT
jgi:hypothetical protein